MNDHIGSGIHFEPWVGTNYQQGCIRGLRTLILGESHYIYKEKPILGPGHTIEHVKEVITRPKPFPFWNSLFPIISDINRRDTNERRVFLSKIIYYNFIQRELPDSKTRPNDSDWANSISPFKAVIACYQPEFVLVCGLSIWGAISSLPHTTTQIQECSFQKELRHYSFGNISFTAYGIRHPSSLRWIKLGIQKTKEDFEMAIEKV